ncbi:MAG: zincin-like metallopeptidase domain-containing protein [Bacteroidetes bacterium]|nr:zincin-like metallopeptidase domain-containing protein [Bacteroidota bacterium]
MKTNEIYSKVTEKIIANLQTAGSWQALWEMPRPVSLLGYFYNGINFFNLACAEHSTPVWGTFQQIRQNGGHVKKGEAGSIVVFWKPMKDIDPITLEEKMRYLLRYYYVFNAYQCEFDELGLKKVAELSQLVDKQENSNTRNAEEIIAHMSQCPAILHPTLIDFPHYNITLDTVNMPKQDWYSSLDQYYTTLFHELVHSTGHPSRLNRFSTGAHSSFGKEEYSKEELVAELGASFLAEVAGLKLNVENAAAYIRSWSEKLRDNTSWIVWAAARAEKAANFILGKPQHNYDEPEEETANLAMAEEPWHYGKKLSIYCLFEFSTPQIARVKIHQAWPVSIPGFEAFNFYVHKFYNTKDEHWNVTEGYSGLAVTAYEHSRKEAIEITQRRLQGVGPDQFRSMIHEAYRKYGHIYQHRVAELDNTFSEVGIDNISAMRTEDLKRLVSHRYLN